MSGETEGMKLIVTIVERGKGSAIGRMYSQNQVFWQYQCAGRGTASSELLDVLGFGTAERDILISIGAGGCVQRLMHELNNELRTRIRAKGIAFSMRLTGLNNLLARMILNQEKEAKQEEKGAIVMEQSGSHSLILVAVNQGHTDEVMNTANKAGARGGSIIRSRWVDSGVSEKFYGISVQEEKEIIALVVPTASRNMVMESINKEHGLKSEARAVICSVGLDQVVRLG